MNVRLNNGVEMPVLGLGTWKMTDERATVEAVKNALDLGYRLIDTAKLYGNEASVGQAIKDSGIKREDIFVTTKLWNDSHDYDVALKAFDASLERLGMDYVDLYLIHWPGDHEKYLDAWRALEKIYEDKRARAIGVSNFEPGHLDKLLTTAKVVPAIDQVQLHPYHQQRQIREYCRPHDIRIMSYSPLQRAGELLKDPVISQLAANHGKTSAQIVLRWHVQSGFVTIPKSSSAARQKENFDIFDFELSDDDMWRIAALDRD